MMSNLTLQHWSLAAERLQLLLVDVTIKSVIIIAIAGLLALALSRASASWRHLIWLLALVGTLCLPVLTALVPSREIHSMAGSVRVEHKPSPVPPHAAYVPNARPAPADTATVNGQPAAATVTKSVAESPAAIAADSRANLIIATGMMVKQYSNFSIGLFAAVVSAFWLLGVVILLGRMALALLRLRALRCSLAPLAEGNIAALAAEIAREIGLRRRVRLFLAEEGTSVAAPLTWGFHRPLLILPSDAAEWPAERLRAALLHEIAHIQRGDWQAQMLASVACSVYWFNPFIWLAAHRMRSECERAADDYALTHGLRASDYATHLLEIAQAAQSRRQPPRQAVAMVRRASIEARLRAILSRHQNRQPLPRRWRDGALIATALLLVVGSTARFSAKTAGSLWVNTPVPIFTGADRYAHIARPGQNSVTLPNGATVKLVGIADTQAAGPTQWWAPDGSPVTEPLPKNTLVFLKLPSGVQGRAFAIETVYDRTVQPKSIWAAAPQFSWDYIRSSENASVYSDKPSFTDEFEPDEHIKFLGRDQESEARHGSQTSQLTITALASRASRKTVILRYAVAAGPWTQSVTCLKRPGKTYVKTPSGDVIFTVIPNPHHLPAAQAAKRNAIVMVSDHFRTPSPEATSNSLQVALRAAQNYDRTILALDRSGRAVTVLRGDMISDPDRVPDAAQRNYSLIKTSQECAIPNSVLKRVASFRLLARPYQWAEFRDVPLQPLTAAPVGPASATQTIPGGGTIELAGISYNPSAHQPWWDANGTRLAHPPAKMPEGTISTGKEQHQVREFIFNAHGIGADASFKVAADGSLGSISSVGGFLAHASAKDSTSIGIVAALPASARACTVRVGVANQPWKVVETDDRSVIRSGKTSSSSSTEGSFTTIFSPPSTLSGKLAFTVSDTVNDQATRIVAIDRHGRIVAPDTISEASTDQTTQRTIAFPTLKLDDIKSLQLQARPYHWVEFREVPLQPK